MNRIRLEHNATIRFQGAGDDLVEVYQDGKILEEVDADFDTDSRHFRVDMPGDQAFAVHAHFGPAGCWYFAVGLAGKDQPLPPRLVPLFTSEGGTTVLLMTLPSWNDHHCAWA